MSIGSIGDHLWAEMTDGQKVDAVYRGQATLKQMSEGLLDGSEELRNACREFLAHTDPSFENLAVDDGHLDSLAEALALAAQNLGSKARPTNKPNSPSAKATSKQRFGLPQGFVPRLQRYGRAVLIELNVYRLPDGQEFIPCHPTGTLGTRHHLYALLTAEQYLKGKRGSVYVRNDGRIFDYSADSAMSGDLFDTGYTIYDLERTGRYAPTPRPKRKKRQPDKYRRAAAGG